MPAGQELIYLVHLVQGWAETFLLHHSQEDENVIDVISNKRFLFSIFYCIVVMSFHLINSKFQVLVLETPETTL